MQATGKEVRRAAKALETHHIYTRGTGRDRIWRCPACDRNYTTQAAALRHQATLALEAALED